LDDARNIANKQEFYIPLVPNDLRKSGDRYRLADMFLNFLNVNSLHVFLIIKFILKTPLQNYQFDIDNLVRAISRGATLLCSALSR
jgi:hypothetical protein